MYWIFPKTESSIHVFKHVGAWDTNKLKINLLQLPSPCMYWTIPYRESTDTWSTCVNTQHAQSFKNVFSFLSSMLPLHFHIIYAIIAQGWIAISLAIALYTYHLQSKNFHSNYIYISRVFCNKIGLIQRVPRCSNLRYMYTSKHQNEPQVVNNNYSRCLMYQYPKWWIILLCYALLHLSECFFRVAAP